MSGMRAAAAVLILVAVDLAGCASAPTGPSVMVLPATGKSMEQFQAEDARCRQIAAAELARVPGGQVSDQKRYDMAYLQCMYAEGNQIPVSRVPGYSAPGGAAPPTVTRPSGTPAPPAGPPPPPPSSR